MFLNLPMVRALFLGTGLALLLPTDDAPCVSANFLDDPDLMCTDFICCEMECCGSGAVWETGTCREDLESPGFFGDYPPEFDHGCCRRDCCEEECCGYGTEWDELLSRCVYVDEFESDAPTTSPNPAPSQVPETSAPTKEQDLCKFKGFEDDRYQQHDDLICKCVKEFNEDKKGFADGTDAQAAMIADLDPNLVKAWLIQESGGTRDKSLKAWKKDPAQVNVPGDWSKFKGNIGLKEPKKRNEGNLETNLKAALKWLVRKGFGKSGQPTKNRPTGTFDGWAEALKRYNGRSVITTNGKPFRDNYSKRITDRNKDKENKYEIKLPKAKK